MKPDGYDNFLDWIDSPDGPEPPDLGDKYGELKIELELLAGAVETALDCGDLATAAATLRTIGKLPDKHQLTEATP